VKPAEWTLEPGERLETVAYRLGVAPQALWLDHGNAELRNQRATPEDLQPGDVLSAPEKKAKREPVNPGSSVRFRRKYAPAWLRITMWIDGTPRARGDCAVVVDGQLIRLVLSEEGVVDCPVPLGAETAVLMVLYGDHTPDVELDLKVPATTTELEVGEAVLRIQTGMAYTTPVTGPTS
jgi:hypothetical protein